LLCRGCQRENRAGARFCAACGAPFPRACAVCGHDLPQDAAFCDACGAAQVAAAGAPEAPPRDPRAYTPRHMAERILTSRGALEGERKHVTVLFADVAGFTALAERRDPEEVHALMDRFFQLVLDEVHRCEGTVNQFLGDGVMALSAVPALRQLF
jgi:class 3 adenylate cyclase